MGKVNKVKANKGTILERYAEESIHFLSISSWTFVQEMVEECARDADSFRICDLGCGDGASLFALHSHGLLQKSCAVVGVDISPKRIERLEQLKEIGLRQVTGIVSDACSVKQLANESFDLIICSQLIEHVEDDKALVREIHRLLKEDGKAYISSVIRKRPGIWLYRNNGKWVLDPTHVREYSSESEFVTLCERNGLTVIKTKITPCRFPICDMAVRLLIRGKLISPDIARYLFLSHSLLQRSIRRVRFPILGFYIIEAVCCRSQLLRGVSHETT